MVPQIIILCLVALGTGGSLAKHGEPRTGKHDAVTTVIANAITLGLLYWGGFFDVLLEAIK